MDLMRKAVTIAENKLDCGSCVNPVRINDHRSPLTMRLTKINSTSKSSFHFFKRFSSNS